MYVHVSNAFDVYFIMLSLDKEHIHIASYKYWYPGKSMVIWFLQSIYSVCLIVVVRQESY